MFVYYDNGSILFMLAKWASPFLFFIVPEVTLNLAFPSTSFRTIARAKKRFLVGLETKYSIAIQVPLEEVSLGRFYLSLNRNIYSATRETFSSRTCIKTKYSIAIKVPLEKVFLVVL